LLFSSENCFNDVFVHQQYAVLSKFFSLGGGIRALFLVNWNIGMIFAKIVNNI